MKLSMIICTFICTYMDKRSATNLVVLQVASTYVLAYEVVVVYEHEQ